MKISDAIALGSVVLKPKSGTIYDPKTDSGCALGMAGKAAGVDISFSNPFKVAKEWPWITKIEFQLPCMCLRKCDDFKFPALNVIAHLFDYHIMNKNNKMQRWTLEQLIDWVRKVEPQDGEASVSGTGDTVSQETTPDSTAIPVSKL